MAKDYSKLFTPFKIGNVELKNRYIMGPMGFSDPFDDRGVLTETGINYFLERAKGGFGMIYTGVMLVDDVIDPVLHPSPLVYSMDFRAKACVLNERCDAYGTKIFAEIGMGMGRNFPGMHTPSAVEPFGDPNGLTPELTKDQIHQKIDQMVAAAQLMKASDFAGVDIHTIHWGYLIDEFVMAITNHREDEYGGTLENRLRVVKEITEGIKQTCGSDFPVTIGLAVKTFIKALNKASLTGEEEAGRTVEEAVEIAKMLEAMGIDGVMLDTGIYDSFYYACPPIYMPKGHAVDLYKPIKDAVSIPVFARSKMGDPDIALDALDRGIADAVVVARPALADPYLPEKVETGKISKIRPCIGCNIGCIGALGETGRPGGCAVNPRVFHEAETAPYKTTFPKTIAVVGGGIAGMEAARAATECGHRVKLYEKADVLGGEMIPAGAHEFKPEMNELTEWYKNELAELAVEVKLGTEATPEMIAADKPDAVILALGASAVVPKSIKGIDGANVITGVDALTTHAKLGDNIIVVGGGQVGVETAIDYAMQGKKVTLIEAMPGILNTGFIPIQHQQMLRDMLEHYKVEVKTSTKLVEITADGVVTEPADGGAQEKTAADNVVLSMGLRPNPSMRQAITALGIPVYEVGSGRKNGNVYNAIHEAFEVAYHI